MLLTEIKKLLNPVLYSIIEKQNFKELRPAQEKAINAGLFDFKNILVCTPTASGKTLIAEMAAMNAILNNKGKAIYVVPLRALATEKYNDFRKKYGHIARIRISIGDFDSADTYLEKSDLIITTSEKLDSLIRHNAPWLHDIKVVVIDEIHLITDIERGPTLEILITILKEILGNVQLIGLSATIGNPQELAGWLNANLVEDDWRPVELRRGIYFNGEIEFY
ncbi:MAG: DEAD/DEAH box helicase [Candidatus Woesearchaeota archaeon]